MYSLPCFRSLPRTNGFKVGMNGTTVSWPTVTAGSFDSTAKKGNQGDLCQAAVHRACKEDFSIFYLTAKRLPKFNMWKHFLLKCISVFVKMHIRNIRNMNGLIFLRNKNWQGRQDILTRNRQGLVTGWITKQAGNLNKISKVSNTARCINRLEIGFSILFYFLSIAVRDFFDV